MNAWRYWLANKQVTSRWIAAAVVGTVFVYGVVSHHIALIGFGAVTLCFVLRRVGAAATTSKESDGSNAAGHFSRRTAELPKGGEDRDGSGQSAVQHAAGRSARWLERDASSGVPASTDAFVEELLRNLGHEVVHAASARAALGALADGRAVDLVFSDVMMPGGTSGIELAREVRQRYPALPVLLTSGYSGAIGTEAEALGIEILRKPYGIEALRQAIARARGAMAAHAPVHR